MNKVPNPMIEELAGELEPVRPLRLVTGLAWIAAAIAATLVAVELAEGFWRGLFTGRASALFFITNGLLAILAAAGIGTVLRMVRPRVGNRHEGPEWAMAMLLVLPAAALLTMVLHDSHDDVLADPYGLACAAKSLAASALTFLALVLWLRRGAPVSLSAAGLHSGIAAGAVGALTYGLSCPVDTIAHLGIWHIAPVALAALIGRYGIPPLVRW